MNQATLEYVAQVCREHLTEVERATVAAAICSCQDIMVELMAARGGDEFEPRAFARFLLQCADRAIKRAQEQ